MKTSPSSPSIRSGIVNELDTFLGVLVLRVLSFLVSILAVFSLSTASADMTLEQRDVMFNTYVQNLKPNQNIAYDQLVNVGKGMNVVVLGGYSGQDYQNPAALRAYIKNIMSQQGPNTMYVIGSTTDGIGRAYNMIPEIAKELGQGNVKTAGIVSRNAAEYGIAKSVDYNVFVDTAPNDWNVRNANGKSLMVQVAKDTHGQLIYSKGGAVSVNELTEATKDGVRATLIRDADLSTSTAVATKKIARANPALDPQSDEFQQKVQESMKAADEPTAQLANSPPAGLRVTSTPDNLAVTPEQPKTGNKFADDVNSFAANHSPSQTREYLNGDSSRSSTLKQQLESAANQIEKHIKNINADAAKGSSKALDAEKDELAKSIEHLNALKAIASRYGNLSPSQLAQFEVSTKSPSGKKGWEIELRRKSGDQVKKISLDAKTYGILNSMGLLKKDPNQASNAEAGNLFQLQPASGDTQNSRGKSRLPAASKGLE